VVAILGLVIIQIEEKKMAFSQRDIAEAMAMLESAEEMRPIIDAAIDTLLSFGPELGTLAHSAARAMANIRTTYFNQLTSNGFSREEAMLLTIDSGAALGKAMSAIKRKAKSS
jgi:hypothetical protein